jgi:predicted nucleotide-binding protein (sugar kinase/HSP70/actin superfamily)
LKKEHIRENYRAIVKDFKKIKRTKEPKVKVGIVGEIYVKFSPLGNNHLEDFLYHEDVEVFLPGLYDFCLYCVENMIMDNELYKTAKIKTFFIKKVYQYLINKQNELIEAVKEIGGFRAPTSFEHTKSLVDGYISRGAKMGEGWLLTAEMLEIIESSIDNIVCTQPFGCLPNHIVGKGMMKTIKENNENANILAIDYDASASKINQENRIKLMLASAKERLKEQKKTK